MPGGLWASLVFNAATVWPTFRSNKPSCTGVEHFASGIASFRAQVDQVVRALDHPCRARSPARCGRCMIGASKACSNLAMSWKWSPVVGSSKMKSGLRPGPWS